MSFDSLTYLLFLPAVCAAHWLCPARHRWMVLLAASYVFYASWNAALSLLILGVTAWSWLACLLLERARRPAARRAILACALAGCLGVLVYFKYYNLIGRTAALIAGGRWRARDIILPVGISFYTFQAMSCAVDVYRGSLRAERHFGYYALYISFFPQLVAGPIERAGALLPQLRSERVFSREDLSAGLRLIVCGFFRKLAAADLAAPFVDAVYGADCPDGSAVLAATLLFALQIYCDFSGYSQIAAGSARLMGVRLMRNFDRPYGARNIRDFWRRWHISLTGWFTDYVYIPLGGSRRGLPRQLLASCTVFALCGLWHGASWSFLVWGLFHACLMAVYTLRRRWLPDRPSGRGGQAMTMAAVCFSWLFFRAGDMGRAAELLSRLFSPWDLRAGLSLLLSAPAREVPPLVLGLLLAALLLILRRLPAAPEEKENGLPEAVWAGLILAVAAAALIRMDQGTAGAFIYFQF